MNKTDEQRREEIDRLADALICAGLMAAKSSDPTIDAVKRSLIKGLYRVAGVEEGPK
jgi:hypothetical protein